MVPGLLGELSSLALASAAARASQRKATWALANCPAALTLASGWRGGGGNECAGCSGKTKEAAEDSDCASGYVQALVGVQSRLCCQEVCRVQGRDLQ